MKTIWRVVLTIAFLTFSSTTVLAAESSVSIQNNVNTTQNNSSSSNCHTTVHTEVNGKVQDYTSDNCGSVTVHNDGINSDVNNTNGPTATPQPTPTPIVFSTPTTGIKSVLGTEEQATNEADKTMQKIKKEVDQKNETLFAKFENLLKRLFEWLNSKK